MERVQFITHKAARVLKVDLSHSTSIEENVVTLKKARILICTKPPESVLILTDLTKTHFNVSAVEELKKFSQSITPFVKASAVLGAVGVIHENLIRLVGRDIARFDTEAEALDWLAER